MYLTSTDPSVIETVEANRARHRRFVEKATAWARERGASEKAKVPTSDFVGVRVLGLYHVPEFESFGRWKVRNKHGVSVPFRTNTAEIEIMEGLSYTPEPVGGLPDDPIADDPHTGQTYFLNSTPFVHDGSAWIHYAYPVEGVGEQWTECLASAWHAAHEGWVAARKAEQEEREHAAAGAQD